MLFRSAIARRVYLRAGTGVGMGTGQRVVAVPIVGEEQRPGTPMCQLKAHMPVMESFGFTPALRKATGGKAFPQMIFSHWAALEGDPLNPGTMPGKVVTGVRVRKGLEPEVPGLDRFLDKL